MARVENTCNFINKPTIKYLINQNKINYEVHLQIA